MNWTEQDIETAWEHGTIVDGFKPEFWRKDKYGAWISRQHFGDQNSPFGWEIVPDLKPFQWHNAHLKPNGRLVRPVTAYGGININLDIL